MLAQPVRYFVSFHWIAQNGHDGFGNMEVAAPGPFDAVHGPTGIEGVQEQIRKHLQMNGAPPLAKVCILFYTELAAPAIVVGSSLQPEQRQELERTG